MKKYLTESVNLLSQIKGQRITRMVRLFRGDVNHFLEDFPKIQEQELFSSSGYSLFIQLEALGWIAFSECEREISVLVWHPDELPALKAYADSEINNGSRQQYIECSHEKYSAPYWRDFIGTKVTEIKIVSLSIDMENIRSFRNERGLWIATDNGAEFIIETSLATKDIPGGLNVIRKHQIHAELQNNLVFRDILERSAGDQICP